MYTDSIVEIGLAENGWSVCVTIPKMDSGEESGSSMMCNTERKTAVFTSPKDVIAFLGKLLDVYPREAMMSMSMDTQEDEFDTAFQQALAGVTK